MSSSTTLNRLAIVAALALTVSGVVHLMDAPDTMADGTYLGLSFYAQFIVTIVAAVGILLGSRLAWGLGALVAGGSLAMYVISRTVGLPGQSGEDWFEWAGLIAIASEAIALGATVAGLRLMRTARAAFAPAAA
ncbi:MAG: hypothetical protein U0869_08420 [Chloroflexota bacterium]